MTTGNRMDTTRNFFTFNGTVQISSNNTTATGQTVKFDRIGGSIGDADPTAGYRIKLLSTRTDDVIYLLTFCEANASYYYTEKTIKVRRSRLSNSTPTDSAQTIPALPSNAVPWIGTNSPFLFNGTASSGLPIEFRVDYGPAVVANGSHIKVSGIPIGSTVTSYKVRVYAGQRGSHPSFAGATGLNTEYTLNGTFPANAPLLPEPFSASREFLRIWSEGLLY